VLVAYFLLGHSVCLCDIHFLLQHVYGSRCRPVHYFWFYMCNFC